MRIRLALLFSGIVALAATVPVAVGAAPTPSPSPSPSLSPSPSPSGLPIGNIKVQITQPGQTPSGANHVETPPFNK